MKYRYFVAMNHETIKRFWSKVKKTSGCWLWTASKRNKGYGAFVWAGDDGRIIQGRAHRFSYEIAYGSIDPGMCVLHRCDTPACVRPSHLFVGSKAENNRDMVVKGRHVPGGTRCGANGKWKRGPEWYLSRGMLPRQLCAGEIRKDRDSGMTYKELADKHGCSVSHACRICTKGEE